VTASKLSGTVQNNLLSHELCSLIIFINYGFLRAKVISTALGITANSSGF